MHAGWLRAYLWIQVAKTAVARSQAYELAQSTRPVNTAVRLRRRDCGARCRHSQIGADPHGVCVVRSGASMETEARHAKTSIASRHRVECARKQAARNLPSASAHLCADAPVPDAGEEGARVAHGAGLARPDRGRCGGELRMRRGRAR